MSKNIGDTGAGTTKTDSATTKGGSASGTTAPGGKNAAPADAPLNAPQSGTPAFAKPGESALNIGAPGAEGAPVQSTASVGYPFKITTDGHTHAGRSIKKGQTIALDAAEYRWATQAGIGEAGKRDDVGLDVDAQGNVIKPTTPDEIALPESEAIHPETASK